MGAALGGGTWGRRLGAALGVGAWAQQRWKFLVQLLYLWRECGDCGGSLETPGANEESGTCLGEGVARGQVLDLLF